MAVVLKGETAEEFLNSTESAVKHLFHAIESYKCLFRKGILKGPFGSIGPNNSESEEIITRWRYENAGLIAEAIAAQRSYSSERFALAMICGALLQIADKALKMHSKNTIVSVDWNDCVGAKYARYCVGRQIRSVPIGLIVYAARNQATHFEEPMLREPSAEVFNRLARNHGVQGYDDVKDPSFDLGQHKNESLAAGIVSLLEWSSYDSYLLDMQEMLSAEVTV